MPPILAEQVFRQRSDLLFVKGKPFREASQ